MINTFFPSYLGVYGHWLYDLGIGTTILVFVQLVFACVLLMLLDELIQRGYGLGNGVSLFIAIEGHSQFWSTNC